MNVKKSYLTFLLRLLQKDDIMIAKNLDHYVIVL